MIEQPKSRVLDSLDDVIILRDGNAANTQGQGQGQGGGEGDNVNRNEPISNPVEFTIAAATNTTTGLDDLSALEDVTNEQRDKRNWSTCQVKLVFFALAWNAFNLLRFPDSIYKSKSGGGALMLAYLAIMVCVMQPLVYFELLLGQLYLRKNSHRGIKEQEIFSFVAKGIGAGTFLTGLFFLPNQLVSMNYAGLQISEALAPVQSSSSCACEGLLLDDNYLNPNESCMPLNDVFRTPGQHFQHVQGAALSCELFHRQYLLNNANGDPTSFPESLNWKLLIPSAIGALLVLILSLKKLPNNIVALLVWISPLLFFATLVIVGSQISRYGFQEGVCALMSIDLSAFVDLDFKVWAEASKLAFITSGVGFGILPVIASSNPRRFPHLYCTSWTYITTICVACFTSTFITFSEIGVLSIIMHETDLRKVISEAINLPLITFCSISCKTEQLMRCFAHTFVVLIFIASCWPKSIICQGTVSTDARVSRIKRVLLLPFIMFLIEAIYILPEARFLLADASFFGGAWTSCAITLIRILAFVSVCTLNNLKIHVRECVRQNIPGFFVFQMKVFMIPFVLAMFCLLCLDMLEVLPLSSADAKYPEWLKVYGTVLNSLPIIVLFFCCINEIYVASYKGSPTYSSQSSLSNFPLNHQPVDSHIRAGGKLTITKKSPFRDAISTRPRPMLTSFRSFGDEPPLAPPPTLPTGTGRSNYEVRDHANERNLARELLKSKISWPMLEYDKRLMIAANVGGCARYLNEPDAVEICDECTDRRPRSRISGNSNSKVKALKVVKSTTNATVHKEDLPVSTSTSKTNVATHEYAELKPESEDEVLVAAADPETETRQKPSPPVVPPVVPPRNRGVRRSQSAIVLPAETYEKEMKILDSLEKELEKEAGASGDQAGTFMAMVMEAEMPHEPMDANMPIPGSMGDCARYY